MTKTDKEKALVRLQQSSLDEKNGEIVAHGWLDIEAIKHLLVGDYQREIIESRGGRKNSIQNAIDHNERLPDIMLGMRGESYTPRGGAMLLENDVFIIDGLQRISALRKVAAENPDKIPQLRIGAEVRFNTTRDSEKELFTILNVRRRAMSPNVILRNERNHSTGVATLFGLSTSDRNHAMYGRVCWTQQMNRGELVSASTFAKTAITLHRHNVVGGRHIATLAHLPDQLDKVVKTVGMQVFRANLNAFYEVMDEVWGIRGIKYNDKATHTRFNFMNQLASLFSDHEEFWDGLKLTIDAAQKAKLKSFPINDPTIIRLAGAGTTVGSMLLRHFIDHMNKNKPVNRHLTTRHMPQPKHPKHRRKYLNPDEERRNSTQEEGDK
jgi:hypothetical protein